MLLGRPNVALNPRWILNDRNPSNAALTSGRPATCWTFDWNPAGVAGAGSPGGVTMRVVDPPSDAPGYVEKVMEVVVTASSYDPTALPVLYQKVHNSARHGRMTGRMTVWAQGTDGGSFLFGQGDGSKVRYQRFDTVGLVGEKSWKRVPFEQTFDDIATNLSLHAFAAPADLNATYRLAYVLEEYVHGEFTDAGPTVPPIRDQAEERGLCLHRSRPIGRFDDAYRVSNTKIAVRVKCLPQMRSSTVQPTQLANGQEVVFTGWDGTDYTAASATVTFDATDRGADGVIAYVDGFSPNIPAGAAGYLSSLTVIGVLESEIA